MYWESIFFFINIIQLNKFEDFCNFLYVIFYL